MRAGIVVGSRSPESDRMPVEISWGGSAYYSDSYEKQPPLSLDGSRQDALDEVHSLYYNISNFKTSTSSLEATADNGLRMGKSLL